MEIYVVEQGDTVDDIAEKTGSDVNSIISTNQLAAPYRLAVGQALLVRGTTRARTLGNVEAVQMAVFYGVPIPFDETAQSPYFRYWQYGVEHEVWFEDVRSYEAKFRLVQEYGLRGIGVWQIMQLFRAGWELLNDRFRIRKL